MTDLSRRNFFRLAAGAAVLVAVPKVPLAQTIYCDGMSDDGPGLTALLRGEAVEFADPSIASRIGWVTPDHVKLFGRFTLKTPVHIGPEFSGKRLTGGHYDVQCQYGFECRDADGVLLTEMHFYNQHAGISLVEHEDHMAQASIRWRGVCPVNCGLPGDQCACFRHLNDTGSKPSDPVMIHLTLPRHAQG